MARLPRLLCSHRALGEDCALQQVCNINLFKYHEVVAGSWMEDEFQYDVYEETVEIQSEYSDEFSDDEEPSKRQKIGQPYEFSISIERANEILDKAGTLVEASENTCVVIYPQVMTDPVTIMISEAKNQLNITFELKEFQIQALHSLAALKDTIVNVGCGCGKMIIFYLGIVILRRILNIKNGLGICLQPTNDLREEKISTCPPLPTAFLTRKGNFKLSNEETEFSEPVDLISSGEFPALLASAEAFACSNGKNFLNIVHNQLVLGAADEGHLFQDWGTDEFRVDMSQIPRNLHGLMRGTGAPFLILSATESKLDIKSTKIIFDLQPQSTIIRSNPVLSNHMFVNLTRSPNGFLWFLYSC